MLRTPAALFAALVAPLLFLWAAMQLFGALPGQVASFPVRDYPTFAAPALCVAGVLPGAVWCGAMTYWERRLGMLDALLAAPLARIGLLTSALLSGVPLSLLTSLVFLLVVRAGGLDIAAGIAGVPGMLCLAALTGIPFGAAAFVLGAVVRRGPTLTVLCGTLVVSAILLSDTVLPAALLPGWLDAVAALNPVTHAAAGARALVWLPLTWETFRHEALILALIDLMSVIIALLSFPLTIGGA